MLERSGEATEPWEVPTSDLANTPLHHPRLKKAFDEFQDGTDAYVCYRVGVGD
jgi:hypothetical protein